MMAKEIMELKPGDCRWIVNDQPPKLYCAEPAVGGTSWCAGHYRICHGKVPAWLVLPAPDQVPLPAPVPVPPTAPVPMPPPAPPPPMPVTLVL